MKTVPRAVSELMLFSPALYSFEESSDEPLYQEIVYPVNSEKDNMLDNPGMSCTLISVHELALAEDVYLQQTQTPNTNPTSHNVFVSSSLL
jgi:hypothetical protein